MSNQERNVPMWRTEGLTKVFPAVKALDALSFEIYSGQVHGLLGENGSGKSTLVKCLSGVYQPDGGSIFKNGVQIHLPTPESARKAGV
ncbi:MAG: ATP-binding cassette domain-containing protein, partial [Spirochaetaceae bacterium]|nr:ATP-binding cassette domain-containing protein [Spirochaetaceae bacterium]